MTGKASLMLLVALVALVGAGVIFSSAPTVTGQDDAEAAKYKGSKACKSCHKDEHTAWLEMKHSHALASLKPEQVATGKDEKGQACVQCHTTGYGKGGYAKAEDTKFANVGCESCHGAGSKHVNVQLKAMMEEEEVTEQFISRNVGCTQCHNPHISYKKLYGGE